MVARALSHVSKNLVFMVCYDLEGFTRMHVYTGKDSPTLCRGNMTDILVVGDAARMRMERTKFRHYE